MSNILKEGIIDSTWLQDVANIRQYLDLTYYVSIGGGSYANVSQGRSQSQLSWGKTGVDHFALRVSPIVSTSLEHYGDLRQAMAQAVKDAISFGNSTILFDTATGSIRVSKPEYAVASITPLGRYEYRELIGDMFNFASDDGNLQSVADISDPDAVIMNTTIRPYTIFYDADGAHPYGVSRLTPAVINGIRGASRNKIRAEIAANFYAFPQRVINGAWADMDASIASGAASMASGESNIQVLPYDPVTGEKLDYSQLPAADFTPFITIQKEFAQEVASALDLNVGELLPSADTKQDVTVTDAMSVAIKNFESIIHDTLEELVQAYCSFYGDPNASLSFAEPFVPQQAAASDALVKLATARPDLVDSANTLRWLGVPEGVIRDIQAGTVPMTFAAPVNDKETGADNSASEERR